jgi:hypothetical protein
MASELAMAAAQSQAPLPPVSSCTIACTVGERAMSSPGRSSLVSSSLVIIIIVINNNNNINNKNKNKSTKNIKNIKKIINNNNNNNNNDNNDDDENNTIIINTGRGRRADGAAARSRAAARGSEGCHRLQFIFIGGLFIVYFILSYQHTIAFISLLVFM